MAKIDIYIPPSAFEVIRDAIVQIIGLELAAQKVLAPLSDKAMFPSKIWIERDWPMNQSEHPSINCSFDGTASYTRDMGASSTPYLYNIDVLSWAKSTPTKDGDSASRMLTQRLLGMIRFIFQDPKYRTLGFASNLGIIQNLTIQSIQTSVMDREDSSRVSAGRLVLSVNAVEKNVLIEPALIGGAETSLKVDQSEEGYFYEI